jgi:Zn-dependent protease
MAVSRFWNTVRHLALPLGNVQGVPIRLHLSFFGLIPLGLVLSEGDIRWTLLMSAMVFVLVLLHECGHLFAARLAGSFYDEMVVWPLGGLVQADTPLRPLTQFAVASAGPAAHLVIAILFLPWAVGHSPFRLWPLPADDYLLLFLTLNRLLLVANLLPAFPTDGGRVWQGLLWHSLGFSRATAATVALSCLLGAGCLAGGVLASSWPLAALGGVLLASGLYCRYTFRVAEVIDGVWIETPGLLGGYRRRRLLVRLRDWRGKRRQEREHLQRVKDSQELDALLHKITKVGLAGLTPRERRFLQRQSDRLQRERGISLR